LFTLTLDAESEFLQTLYCSHCHRIAYVLTIR